MHLSKVKSDYAPWNSIKKINQEKMRDTLFNLIKTKIVNQPQIQSRFDKKREFDALKEQRAQKSSHSKSGIKANVASSHFRPLLVDPSAFITSTPLPVTKTYCDDLKRNLKNGSSLQTEKILVLQSKVIHFSLIIQKLIQEVISSQTKDKTKLLSKNYIQNACCNEREGGVTTLDYMISHVPNIKIIVTWWTAQVQFCLTFIVLAKLQLCWTRETREIIFLTFRQILMNSQYTMHS